MTNAKAKILLYISSFVYAAGIYFLIIKNALDSFHPSLHPEKYLPVLRDRLHPEIEIPLYTWGILFLIVAGYTLYLFLRYILRKYSPDRQGTLVGILFRMSVLSLVLLWWTLLHTPSVFLFEVSSIYLFVTIATTIFTILFPKKFDVFLKILSWLFDVTVITGVLLLLILLLWNIFFTQYFQSSAIVTLMQAEVYPYFQGFSWKEFTLVAIGFSVLAFIYRSPQNKVVSVGFLRSVQFVLDCIVIVGIIFSISIVVPWDSRNWVGIADYGPIIGIINDVLGGKTVLVNSYSQYGLLMPYVVSIVFHFVPLTYFTFFHFLYILTILGYILIFITLRKWFKGFLIPLMCIFLAVQHHYLSQGTNLLFLPMLTFIRWGWWIILFLFFVTKNAIKNEKIQLIIELTLISVAVFWAFDIGMYILFSYITYCIIRDYQAYQSVNDKALAISKSFLLLGVSLLLMFISINIFSYFRSGQIPLWSNYFLHTTLFADGFGLRMLPPVGPYYLIIFLHIGIALYILYALFESRKPTLENQINLPILGFLTAYALLQFLYYVGQSVPGNLHVLILPSLILVSWVLYEVRDLKILASTSFFSISEKVTVKTVGLSIILLFITLTTVSMLHAKGAFERRGPIAYYPSSEYLDRRYRQSINWLNMYLASVPPYERKIAVLSEQDWIFLLETQSTNTIDSGNNYYFILESQYRMLCEQLINRHPSVIFIQNDPGWGWTDILRDCARKRYHFVENIGFLDRWEKDE